MCSSSLTMPVCGQSLLGVFATIADPRGRRGRRHDLAGVLVIVTAAVCAGASSLVVIAEWAADIGRDLRAKSGLLRPGASSTVGIHDPPNPPSPRRRRTVRDGRGVAAGP